MSFNLASILTESRIAHPDKPLCHTDEGATLTYADVDEASGRVATALLDLGLERGDRVAVQLPNVPEFLFTYFGALKAGLIVVPLNPLLKAPEIAHHLHDSGARVFVAHTLAAETALKGVEAAVADGLGRPQVLLTGSGDRPDGTAAFDGLLRAEDCGEPAAVQASDTAALIYTSGTTGRPKGAELTHVQLYMNCTVAGEQLGLRGDDVTMAVLPLFHVFGLSSVLNGAVRRGGTIVLVERFERDAVVAAMARYRCTVFAGVPTMYQELLAADTSGADLSALRIGSCGGAPMPTEVMREVEEAFPGIVVLEGYGLSETASGTTVNTSAEERKVGSIGKPIWGVRVRVVDPEGRELPPGRENVGEIVVRGHNTMKGYWNRPEATAEVLRDGWFHTGDLGHSDEDGYFYVVDRKKDLVVRGGYNVYPREIEEVLYEHPEVTGAAVVGRPDERMGEEVVACIVLEPGSAATEDDLVAFCKERMAAYKYPREIRLMSALPTGPTGKILKKELRG